MRIGFFRRTASYLLDAVPLFLLVFASLSWFVEDIIKNNIDNFQHLEEIYSENLDEYIAEGEALTVKYEDELITYEEYETLLNDLQSTFIHNNEYLINVVVYEYTYSAMAYVIITFVALYTIYVIAMKGNTLGRTIMKIELQGKVNWYNILLRELFWKHMFWFGTLSAGMAIDLGLIAFSKKKRTLRDRISHTYLAPKGVNYPF